MKNDKLKIIVLGYFIRFPLAGMAWHYMQYVLGLVAMGHDVYFIEDSDFFESCYDPENHLTSKNPEYGLRFIEAVYRQLGLDQKWAYYDGFQDKWIGPSSDHAYKICSEADIFLNISGANPVRPWLKNVPARVFIDTDPTFEQVRQLTVGDRRERANHHNIFFTFGENYNDASSAIPVDGLPWQPTRQPIFIEKWPSTLGRRHSRFTTVMQWDSYATREFNGIVYGMKSASFDPYFDLPKHTGEILELALGSNNAPRQRLLDAGWQIRDPLEITKDLLDYQQYIQDSKAEFSIAKQGYVISNSGWFSERSAAYLASGRPVVAQDTGFTHWLETGNGLLAFSTPEEAISMIDCVNTHYEKHCSKAREIAVNYFDSNLVLNSLLDRIDAAGFL